MVKGAQTFGCNWEFPILCYFSYIYSWDGKQVVLPNVNIPFHSLASLTSFQNILRFLLILPLTGCSPPNDEGRKLMALPVRLGDLCITNLSLQSHREFSASLQFTESLRKLFYCQDHVYSYRNLSEQMAAKAYIQQV